MAPSKNSAFAEESAEVQVLLASLTKTRDLTKRIGATLTRLDVSGKVVKDAIGPIYSNTQQLQITSRNIDKVNEAIEKLRQPLDMKGKEEGIIRAGPRSAGLTQYLSALKRIDRALTDLTATNLRSNQQTIQECHSLLSTGVNQLLDLYRSSLSDEDQSIEPLHYITKGLDFPTFTSEKSQYLREISDAIISASAHSVKLNQRDDDQGVKIYADIRGDYLQHSLQNLATASISTSKRSPNDTTVYKPGSNAIGTYAQALENILIAEHKNVTRVFRNDAAPRAYTASYSKSMNDFSKTLAELNTTMRSRILTDCFLAYEIVDLITPVSYSLEKQTGQLRVQISDALRPIRDTARSSLTEIISRTRTQAESITTLPPDGNTIPLVLDTSSRIRILCQYEKPLLYLLASIGDGNWRSQPSNTSMNSLGAASNTTPQSSLLNLPDSTTDTNPLLLSNYLGDLVDFLMSALVNRSQALHRTKSLQAIFILNSVAILTRVTIEPTVEPYFPSGRLDPHRKSATSTYMNAWRESINHLLDTINAAATRPISGGGGLDSATILKSLSSKDKDKIKEKFKSFNASFDEQVARHKSLYMEREVKSALQKEIQSTVEPLYARFWDRYHELDKGKGKTVKYTKSEMAAVLGGL